MAARKSHVSVVETDEAPVDGHPKQASQITEPEVPNDLDGLSNLLGELTQGLSGRILQVQKMIESKQFQIEQLQKSLRTLQAIQAVSEGKELSFGSPAAAKAPRASGGERAPRGSVQQEVLALLKTVPDGFPAGTIIDRLGAKSDPRKAASIRNFLAAGKRAGNVIGYREGSKAYYVKPV